MPEQNKSLLEAMKEYVLQYPNLGDIDLHIDQTESEPVNYSIQTSGLVKLSEDVCGNQTWQYNALLQSREYTADDLSRLNASAFTEDFSSGLKNRTVAGIIQNLQEILNLSVYPLIMAYCLLWMRTETEDCIRYRYILHLRRKYKWQLQE